jgi:excisionase family DNA binding protein
MDEAPRLWSTDELAKETGFTPSWIRRMCATGKIQATMVGRDWVIPDGEAQRVIAERVQQSAE